MRNWMLLCWLLTGLAILTKGLIGIVLPGGAVVICTLWQRDWALWRHLHIGKGVALLLLVTSPWFIMVSIANPEFAEFFFIHEHFDRYTSDVHRRNQGLLYFLPVLLLGLFPWVGRGLKALIRPGFQWLPHNSSGFDAVRFVWVYAVFIYLFFSLGHSMLAPYLMRLQLSTGTSCFDSFSFFVSLATIFSAFLSHAHSPRLIVTVMRPIAGCSWSEKICAQCSVAIRIISLRSSTTSTLSPGSGETPSPINPAGNCVSFVSCPVFEFQCARTMASFSYPIGPSST